MNGAKDFQIFYNLSFNYGKCVCGGGGGGATDTMNDRLVATISLFTVLLKAMKE